MTLQQLFIANLKKVRKERGMSQMTLSGLCDTTSTYIGQIEMGRRIPSFEKIEKIAAALEIAPGQLFSEEKTEGNKGDALLTKDYLQKMPVHVKKEISSCLLSLIKTDITMSLDPREY